MLDSLKCCTSLSSSLTATKYQKSATLLSETQFLKIPVFNYALLSNTLLKYKNERYLRFRMEGCSMFHPHPPSLVILVTCFVSLLEMSSHLFMSFRTTSLSFSSILQFHTISSDKPEVLVIFANCKIIIKKFMNTGNSSKGENSSENPQLLQVVIQVGDSNSIPIFS